MTRYMKKKNEGLELEDVFTSAVEFVGGFSYVVLFHAVVRFVNLVLWEEGCFYKLVWSLMRCLLVKA